MYKHIHKFPEFNNVCDFTANKQFQFMAFLPGEVKAPFIDIHIFDVSGKLMDQYSREILDLLESERRTNDWLVITWFRKMRNGNMDEADRFRRKWLSARLTSEQYRQLKNNSGEFFSDYFSDRDYNQILDFLSLEKPAPS